MVLNFEQDSGYVLMEVETNWWLNLSWLNLLCVASATPTIVSIVANIRLIGRTFKHSLLGPSKATAIEDCVAQKNYNKSCFVVLVVPNWTENYQNKAFVCSF